jgi:hypothetical protein
LHQLGRKILVYIVTVPGDPKAISVFDNKSTLKTAVQTRVAQECPEEAWQAVESDDGFNVIDHAGDQIYQIVVTSVELNVLVL